MLNQKQIDFVKHAKKLFPNKVELTLADLVLANKEFGHKYEPQWLTKDKTLKVDRGLFKLPNIDDDVSEETKVSKTETVKDEKVSEAAYIVSSLTGDIVPKKDKVVPRTTELHWQLKIINSETNPIKKITKKYRVYYKKQNSDDQQNYLIDHTGFTYLVLPEIGFVDFFRRELTAEQLADKVACFMRKI